MSSTPRDRSRADTPDQDPTDPLEADLADLSITDTDPDPDADLQDWSSLSRRQTPGPSGTAATDDQELQSFRERWKLDLQAKQGQGGTVPTPTGASLARDHSTTRATPNPSQSQSQDKIVPARIEREQNIPRDSGTVKSSRSPKASTRSVLSPRAVTRDMPEDLDEDSESARIAVPGPSKPRVDTSPSKVPVSSGQTVPIDRKDQAVSLYSRAVEHEQSGKLNEALMLYRRAFKLDDNVDRLYARSMTKAAQAATTAAAEALPPSSTDVVSSAAPEDEPYSFQRHIQLQPDYEKSHPPAHALSTAQVTGPSTESHRRSPLSLLLSKLPIPADQVPFLPADENLPLPLAKLPLELLDPILANMDIATIERFALTCWRARYVTSRAPIWRKIVHGIYKAPAILPEGKIAKDLDIQGRYGGEWRTALMEEERVRMDGCYISVCHYIRPGAGDQWVTITHMITYHRFLRFYPDGSVISFLTTDHPSEVVPLLRPSLRGKGLHFGRWRLIRSDSPENASLPPLDPGPQAKAAPPSGKKRARVIITDLLEPGSETPKYEFEMELALRETGRGRWNKLDIANYQSINLSNGESLALSLKHQKPFYFSNLEILVTDVTGSNHTIPSYNRFGRCYPVMSKCSHTVSRSVTFQAGI